MNEPLGYDYRRDGFFLCRVVCRHCSEIFDMLALANSRDYCPACEQVMAWERELARTDRDGK